MMDFIYELYQNDNFVLYLTIALVILIILFVLVLIFGKRDQKLEETRKLQKIDVDAFKEQKPTEEVKVEIPAPDVKAEEPPKMEETKEEQPAISEEIPKAKSIFDDTQVLPIASSKESEEPKEEIEVTTFEPTLVKEEPEPEIPQKAEIKTPSKPLIDIDEENKPINIKELDEIKFDDISLENDLNELENIKKQFDSIKLPKVDKNDSEKSEKKEEKVEKKSEDRKGYNSYKPGPQVFSSVFVNKEAPKEETDTLETPIKKAEEKPKVNLFSIADEEDEEVIELPTLKSAAKKNNENKENTKTFNIDEISGESYDVK